MGKNKASTFSSFHCLHSYMKRPVINTLIILLVCFTGCLSFQDSNAQQNSRDSIYTYRTSSPGGTGKFYLGMEIAHVMGASNADWLDRSSRPQEEHTQLAIDTIKVPSTAVIADIGAGTGYYTFKLAPKVANSAQV